MYEKQELVSSYLAEEREKQHFPGLTVAIVHDQKTILASGWGYANLETQIPAQAKTNFRIGSITKVFTSMLVMQAIERDLTDLDDPLESTIPEISKLATPTPITLRHCLTHTSGLPMMPPLPELIPNFSGMPTLEDIASVKFPQVERIIETLADTQLSFTPAEGHTYSNFGMTLAGEVIARKIGISYRQAMTDNLWTPLGMEHTRFTLGKQLATGYFDFGEGPTALPDYEIAGFAPAGGIFSNAIDMAKFIAWNFHPNPTPILSSKTRDWMRVKQHPLESGRYVPGTHGAMGFGWFLSNIGPHTLVEHGGADMGYVAFLGLIPELKWGVFLATNTGQDPTAIAKMAHEVLAVLVEPVFSDWLIFNGRAAGAVIGDFQG